jgi:YfiH family protein
MFRARHHRNEFVGYEATVGNVLFFFGTRYCPRDLLPELFPQLKFCYLKQVHGNEIIPARMDQWSVADGHYTREKNLALVIQSADCLPILLAADGQVMALHAGWRGLAAQIIEKGASKGKVDIAAIGPHIRAESYEVGIDVAHRLRAVSSADAILPHPLPEKRFVDLTKIAQQHLKSNFPKARIETIDGNTYTSTLFYSYRRGKEKDDRQYSFVALNELSR